MEYYTDSKFYDLQQIFPHWDWWTIDGGYYLENEAEPIRSLSRHEPHYSFQFIRDAIGEQAIDDWLTNAHHRASRPDDLSLVEEQPPYIAAIRDNRQRLYYRPMDDSMLFLEFASCGNDLESALEFTTTHGNLTASIIQRHSDRAPRYADSFPVWRREHEDLSWTVKLWEWQRHETRIEPNVDALQKVISWNADKSLEYILTDVEKHDHYASARTLIAAAKRGRCPEGFIYGRFEPPPPDVVSRLKPGDFPLAGSIVLDTIINAKLRSHSPETMVVLNDDNQQVSYQMPNSLIGAMWLQLLHAAIGEKHYKRCRDCGYWEDATGFRSDWKGHELCAIARRQRKYYYSDKGKAKREQGRAEK